MTCKYTRHKATSGAAAAAESTEREKERAENVGRHKHHCQARPPHRRGAEQNREEMGNRQKVRGWLHTSLERTSGNNNLLDVFTVGLERGSDRRRAGTGPLRKTPSAPSLQARTDALNNEFNYKWRSVPPLPPLPRPLARPTAALHREPDWQRPPPPRRRARPMIYDGESK